MHKYNYHTDDNDENHLGRDLFLDILTIIAVCWIAFRGCCKSCCKPQTRETEEVVLAGVGAATAAAPEIALTTLNYPNTVEIPIGGNYSELWEEWNGINGFPSPGHDPPVQLSPDDSGQEPPPSYDEAVNGYWTRISSMIHA
ncbi:uncharacterized protein LOC120427243 [Culex pipiens pallens]|uniref:uncharacterized protein LOC120427243 n=1 Tax=Culex pipiens pallens TaxID=42434 RepID=UPI0019538473|nr:uncharacterized protein LOC120427243 [Culex pipiens pallens]